MTVNTVGTPHELSSRTRPVWSWGTSNGTEVPARAAPEAGAETVELIGRAVPRPEAVPAVPEAAPAWGWDLMAAMQVVIPPPDPWSWAAIAPGREVAPPPPPVLTPAAPPRPTPVRAAHAPAAPAAEWAPVRATAPPPPAPASPAVPAALLPAIGLLLIAMFIVVLVLALHH